MAVAARLNVLGLLAMHVIGEDEARAACILLRDADTKERLAVLALTLADHIIALAHLTRVNFERPVADAVERVLVPAQAALAELERGAAAGHAGAVAVGSRVAPDDLVVLVDEREARVDGDLVAAAEVGALGAAIAPDGVDTLVGAAADAEVVLVRRF